MNIQDLLATAMNRNEYGAVTLGQLIDTLEAAEQSMTVADGFGQPDSWRGVYAFLAFEPKRDAIVADMLKHAKSAVGATFTGYKGGDYTMSRETPCFIAAYGEYNGDEEDALTPERLARMLNVNVAEHKPSNMPKRPTVVEIYRGDDVILSPSQWDAFKAYVCELEAFAARHAE